MASGSPFSNGLPLFTVCWDCELKQLSLCLILLSMGRGYAAPFLVLLPTVLRFKERVFSESQSALIPLLLLLYCVLTLFCFVICSLRLDTVERQCRNNQVPEEA